MNSEYFKKKYGKGWLKYYKSWKLAQDKPKPTHIVGSGTRRKWNWNDFDYYREDVKRLSEENKHNVYNIHKRGFNNYHLDHKISIRFGYDNGIPAEKIAHESNLEMVYWVDNIRKSTQCKIDDENKWILVEEGLATQG